MVSIYALINPINKQVFYIGATVNPKSRLSLHINRSQYGRIKDAIVDDLICCNNLEPELFILDTCSLSDAGYWEVFYTDLYRSYGFNIKKCNMPCLHFDRKSATQKSKNKKWKYANTISDKIDGKDIHYYRRIILNNMKFYQHT